jgi:hypothetical protein
MGEDVVRRHPGDQRSRAHHDETLRRMLNIDGARDVVGTVEQRVHHDLSDSFVRIVGQGHLDSTDKVQRPELYTRLNSVDQSLRCPR